MDFFWLLCVYFKFYEKTNWIVVGEPYYLGCTKPVDWESKALFGLVIGHQSRDFKLILYQSVHGGFLFSDNSSVCLKVCPAVPDSRFSSLH